METGGIKRIGTASAAGAGDSGRLETGGFTGDGVRSGLEVSRDPRAGGRPTRGDKSGTGEVWGTLGDPSAGKPTCDDKSGTIEATGGMFGISNVGGAGEGGGASIGCNGMSETGGGASGGL